MNKIEFITDSEIYHKVILERIPDAKEFLWIATSDIKDLYVKKADKMVPFLKILSELINKGVIVRLIHAKEPGPAFRKDFDKYPNLTEGLERILCPRCHLKTVVIDGQFAYIGSANLTGAGMGAKGDTKRNFESGIITTDKQMIDQIMQHYDEIWMGSYCEKCRRKQFCADYKDILG